MILTGSAIVKAVENGEVEIDPFNRSCVNPNSVDLRLGREVAVYERWVPAMATHTEQLLTGRFRPLEKAKFIDVNGHPIDGRSDVVDVKQKDDYGTVRATMSDDGIVLIPNVLYLMHTEERVTSKSFVPIIDGKSSVGRLGVFVHVTAGYGDTGFDGQFTLEVKVVHPIRLYAGMKICQVRFMTTIGDVTDLQEKRPLRG